MSNKCDSLSDLMAQAYDLSLDLAYTELAPGGHCFTARQTKIGTEKETDMVWAWCDGLIHNYYQDVSSGHCSLQASIDFDIAKFEKSVGRDIATMERLVKRYGKPVVLTCEEMKRRGYRGEWAGEEKDKKEVDIVT